MPMKDGGPAFPMPPRLMKFETFGVDENNDSDRRKELTEVHYEHEGEGQEWSGISLRDYFAAKAMLGFLMCRSFRVFDDTGQIQDGILAGNAYIVADAMLAAREPKE
jgi:hypothetical protein